MEKRVLLIDDDPQFIHLLQTALGGQVNLRVISVPDDAIRICADWRPHLILLDVHIAPGDSFRVLDDLTRCRRNSISSVLCLSRGPGSSTRIERYGNSVFGTLKRESARELLASAVLEALGHPEPAVA